MLNSVRAVVYEWGASLSASSWRRMAYALAIYSVRSRGTYGTTRLALATYALVTTNPCAVKNTEFYSDKGLDLIDSYVCIAPCGKLVNQTRLKNCT